MKKNVALVLSSGGARGIAQIGVINELKKNGFEITSVSGSSIGSVIGGMYAMGKLDEFAAWVCSLNRLDVFKIMDFTISSHGLIKVEKLFRVMEKDFPDMLIEDLNIPYVALATDIANNKEIQFTSGSLYKAMRASIAIPAIITSVEESDQILVDGGVLNPLPIRQVQRTENDILVVVNLYDYGIKEKTNHEEYVHSNVLIETNSKEDETTLEKNSLLEKGKEVLHSFHQKSPSGNNFLSILNKVSTMMLQANAFLSVELHKPDLLINIPRNTAGTFDFHKSEEIIKIGQLAAQQSIQEFIDKQ